MPLSRIIGAPWRHPVRAVAVMLALCIAIAAARPGRVLAVLLSVQLLWLLGAACWFQGPRATSQAFSRAAAAFLLFVLAGVVLCYVVLIYRASPTQVDYSGVYLAPGRTHFAVGTEPGVDVHLAATPDSSPGWRVAISGPRNGKFQIDSVDGVDGLGLRSNGQLSVLRGVHVSSAKPTATLTWQDGDSSRRVAVTLVSTDPSMRALAAGPDTAFIRSAGDTLCEQSALLRSMLRRRLRSGISLDQLEWSGTVPTWAHFFSVRDSSGRWLGAPSGRCAHWYSGAGVMAQRLLSTTRDEELALTARLPLANIAEASAASAASVGDTVVIWSAGSSWEFALDVNQRNDALASAAIRFVRSPRPRLSAFPSASDCALVTTECGLISSHPISGSGPLLLLGAIGLDTARYSLLARAVEDRDTIRVISQDTIRALPINGEIALGAEAADGRMSTRTRQGPGYLLRFHQLTPADIGRVFLACLGLLALCAGAWLLTGGHFLEWGAPDEVTVPTALQRAGWMIGMWITPILGLRLVLGLRISEAAPYVGRGRDAAFAMLATAVLGVIGIVCLPTFRRWWHNTGTTVAATRTGALLALAAVVLMLMEPRPGLVGLVVTMVVMALLMGAPLAAARLDRLWPWWRPGRAVLLTITGMMLALRFGSAQDSSRGVLGLGVRIVAAATWAAFAFRFPRSALQIRGRSAASVSLLLTAGLLLIGLFGQSTFVARPALFGGVLLGLNALVAAAAMHRRPSEADAPTHRMAGAMAPLAVALAPAVIALLLLGADAGLALVAGVPLCFAYLLALPIDAPHRDRQRGGYVLAMLLAVVVLVRTLLAPDTTVLRERMTGQHASVAEQAAAFAQLGRFAGIDVASRSSGARALVRGLAARSPDLLEHALVVAGLSAAQQEIPRSLEQVQGGIAYAVAGWGGKGLVSPTPLGRGVPTAVAYAENTFAVFILHEHGLVGGLIVLLLFLALPVILALTIARSGVVDGTRFAFPIAAVLLVSGPAFYVAAANIGAAPLTGQNIPFLGLNAWVDVLLYGGLTAQFIAFVLGDDPGAESVGVLPVLAPTDVAVELAT